MARSSTLEYTRKVEVENHQHERTLPVHLRTTVIYDSSEAEFLNSMGGFIKHNLDAFDPGVPVSTPDVRHPRQISLFSSRPHHSASCKRVYVFQDHPQELAPATTFHVTTQHTANVDGRTNGTKQTYSVQDHTSSQIGGTSTTSPQRPNTISVLPLVVTSESGKQVKITSSADPSASSKVSAVRNSFTRCIQS